MTRPPLATEGESGHTDRPVSATYSAERPPWSCIAFSGARVGARSSAGR